MTGHLTGHQNGNSKPPPHQTNWDGRSPRPLQLALDAALR